MQVRCPHCHTPIERVDEEAAEAVCASCGSSLVQVVGPRERLIQRVAVACGSGGEFLSDASAHGCDVLVTGEASFHRVLEGEATGVALILAGHFATERFAIEELAKKLVHEFPDLDVWPSQSERDPTWVLQ